MTVKERIDPQSVRNAAAHLPTMPPRAQERGGKREDGGRGAG